MTNVASVTGSAASPLLRALPLALRMALALVLLMVVSAGALPATLITDLSHAELLRASAPGPLAAASVPAPVRGGPSRAVRAAAPLPPAIVAEQPPDGLSNIDVDTEKAAAAAAAAAAAGRPKRDLGVDPEQLMALLALWQQQQQLPQRTPLDGPLSAPIFARHPSRLPGYELNDPDDWELSMDNNDIDSEDDGPVGAWLEAPPFAQSRPSPLFGGPRHSSFFLPALPPPPPPPAGPVPPASSKRETAWGGLAKEKRFMVARKRQANPPSDGVHYLARLFAPPPRTMGIPVVRRVLL